jgi:hypothetical protein
MEDKKFTNQSFSLFLLLLISTSFSFFFSTTFFSAQKAHAEFWSESVLSHVDQYELPYKDPFVSTLLGTCTVKGVKLKELPASVSEWTIPALGMSDSKMDVLRAIQTNEVGIAQKAPLLFVVPGAFSTLGGNQASRWLKRFTNKGYHTIVLPNPWGVDYIKHKPFAPLGDVVAEAGVLYSAMQWILSSFQSASLVEGKVELVGLSHGGFLASIINALDAENSRGILSGPTTSIAPPVDLGATLELLDQHMKETKDPYAGMGTVSVYWKAYKLCNKRSYEAWTEEDLFDAKGVTLERGFHDPLVRSIRKYDKEWDLNSIPFKGLRFLSRGYRRWKQNMNFGKYFETYNPRGRALLESKKGELSYWIDRARAAGRDNLRILTAQDDFLNEENAYDRFDRELILLEDGGHYGYRDLMWFEDFIYLAF